MIRMDLSDIAACVQCASPGTGISIEGVTTDSRKVRPGMLFAALRGERADGHDFIQTAVDKGAAAVLATRAVASPVPQLIVRDVLTALGLLAAEWRRQVDPLVVAITGSNGKTTTRELVTNILARNSGVLSTTGNYNNELGLPLTLFGLEASHEIAVLEMGATRAGDIEYLAGIAQPQVGLVTNVGPAHLQGFGNEEGVARAKGELFTALPATGCAVINGDEPWRTMWMAMSNAGRTLLFGSGPGCQVRAVEQGSGHRVISPAGEFDLHLNLPGEHNLQNALAATAVACALEIPADRIRAGLESTRPVPGRLNLLHSRRGWTVIDDTYNANPASLYAALQVLAHQRGEAWLVLGDMKELGPNSRKMHAEMGDAARSLGVKRLYAIGDVTAVTVDAFGRGARHFPGHEALIEALCADLKPGVSCLVKGSRSMGMERVVQAISGNCESGEAD